MVLFGKKAADTFSKLKNVEVLATATKLGDIPSVEDVVGSAQAAIKEFESGAVGNVYLFANEFINTMTQKPFKKELLPIAEIAMKGEHTKFGTTYTSRFQRNIRSIIEAIYRNTNLSGRYRK